MIPEPSGTTAVPTTTAPAFPRTMASALAPLTVSCARCGEPRGSLCRSSGGYTGTMHAVRSRAVAHLSEVERLAAYDALRSEQDARRVESEAALVGLRSDPDVLVSRRAIGEAWSRICRETAGVS